MKKIISLFLALMLITLPLVSCGKDEEEDKSNDQSVNDETEKEPEVELPGVNFLEDDLSDYIEISEEYYKNFDVLVDPGRVNMLEVENKIVQTLCSYKHQKEIEGDGVISVGDVVYIYYKGYYIKDGEPYFFQGGDNTAESSPYALEIGSGGFILGFEYNLIGKNPKDYNEDNPLVVETFFPENYQSAELAGKTAYFIVTVEKLVEYDAPELDDAFVFETLKLDAEDLKEYEGETLTDKYKSYVKEQVLIEHGLDIDSLVMDAFWKAVSEHAVVKKYPEKQLKETYDSFVEELEYYYEYYSYYYGYEYHTFMCLYLGLEVGSDWQAYLEGLAKEQVKEKLIFFHIMNVEGLKPTAEEYDALFEKYLVEVLAEKGVTPEKYATIEEYNKDKETYKDQLIKQNGEDYFKTMLYYQAVSKGIKSFANIIEITE